MENSPRKVSEIDSDEKASGSDESLSPTLTEPKKSSHSAVWGYFRFKADNDKQLLRCAVKCVPSGNTTNLQST